MEGWIKLHRKILKWEWYDDKNTLCLFLHLLLKANHEEGRWHGHVVPRGSLITGRKKLAKDLGMSEQNVRTSLTRLKSTNEITIETTNNFSLIKVNNWDSHQLTNQQANQRLTNDQPATNHKQEIKNERMKEKKRVPSPNSSIKILDDPKTLEALQGKFPDADVPLEIEKMKDWLAAKGKVQKDYVAFARTWLRRANAQNKLSFKRNTVAKI